MAGIAAASIALSGCSEGTASMSEAPAVKLLEVRDEVILPDTKGADIEVLNLEAPLDFSYSSIDTDMYFRYQDGIWKDGMYPGIPVNQEKLQAMADSFLKLRAIAKVEDTGDLSRYGLEDPEYTILINDSQKGEKNIAIGSGDPSGNRYVMVNEKNIYTVSSEVADSLEFDYGALVIRDSLDITVMPEDMQKAVIIKDGKTKTYKSSDQAVMTRIASGLSSLKPSEYASFDADANELFSKELTEDKRMVLNAEFKSGDQVQSITVYGGTFNDVYGSQRYVQIEGSDMIFIVDKEIVGDLFALTEEENTMQ